MKTTPVRGWTAFLLAVFSFLVSFALPASAQVSVLTQHNDNMRTGANLSETVLKTSNVNVNTFGKLFSRSVDGQIYAQPLYVPGVAIPNKGTHNVVYVATMHDSVYAFDADDPAQSAPLWKVGLGTSRPSGFNTKYGALADIQLEIGITATPVIDSATKTIYVAAYTQDGATGPYHWKLHALDITTGAEKFAGPKEIKPTIAGTGDGNAGGVLTFDASLQNLRPALTLLNGIVYIASASFADTDPYHGWVVGYRASDLSQVSVFNTTRDGGEGGIWMAGQGLVADSAGNLYAMTGNGTSNAKTGGQSYAESFLKLSTANNALTLTDWFMPSNADSLNAADNDLGSAGPLAIPGANLVIGGGKEGWLYLVNTNNMGHYNSTADAVVQKWQAVTTGHIHGAPIYYNGSNGAHIYVWGENDHMRSFAFNGSTFNTAPSSISAAVSPSTGVYGMPGGFMSVSANGAAAGTGIVWATTPYNADAIHNTVAGIFRAFDASDVSKELWNSKQNVSRDDLGLFAKNCPPVVANGKVYVATFSNQLLVYGTGVVPFANGTYKFISQLSNLALDDPNGGGAGTGTDQQTYAGTNQQWNVTLVSGNQYKITSVANGFALTGTTAGAQLTMQAYTGATNQLWTFNAVGTGYTVTNVSSGQLLDVFGNSTAAGGVIGQWGANNGANQKWTITPVLVNGTYKILSQLSNLALDDLNGGGVGTGADQQPYAGVNQQWNIAAVNGTQYKITSAANGLALTGATAGAQLNLQTYTGAATQLWTLNMTGASVYTVTNASTGQVIDDFNNSAAAGGVIGQWTANGGINQSWMIVPVSVAPSCTAKPGAPTGLAASGTTSTGTNLSWAAVAAPANCSISGYTVYRNGTSVGTAGGTNYAVTGLTASTSYTFTVAANDAAGTGTQSASVNITTTAGSGTACYAAWNASTAYNGGAQVSYNGVNYTAAFWTQGNNPSTNNGPAGSGQPWVSNGACS